MSDDWPSGREQARLFGTVWAWVIAMVILIGLIGIGLWAFGVFTSDVKGRGDARKIKNSAINRIQKQEMFESLNADIDGYIAQIKVAREAVRSTSDPTDRELRQTELLGLTQQCISTVQQYNAEGRKYTSRDFRAVDLPYPRSPAKCTKEQS